MPFQIDKSFVVRAPAAAVWDFLTDPRRVARCMPGAALTGQVDDSTYEGTLTVKVGPVSASYRGKMSFARLDAQERSAEIVASGQEVRGKGGAGMRITSRLSERAPGETEVVASSEVNVTGILAQMGRGMIQDVSDQIFRKFTDAMRAELEGTPARQVSVRPEAGETGRGSASAPVGAPPSPDASTPARAVAAAARAEPPHAQARPELDEGAPPLDLAVLGAGAAARAAGRTIRRPAFWIAAAALVVIALWLWLVRAGPTR